MNEIQSPLKDAFDAFMSTETAGKAARLMDATSGERTKRMITEYSMTFDEALGAIGVTDLSWQDQIRALVEAIGGDQDMEDWLVNGCVSGEDTISQIMDDWSDDQEDRDAD